MTQHRVFTLNYLKLEVSKLEKYSILWFVCRADISIHILAGGETAIIKLDVFIQLKLPFFIDLDIANYALRKIDVLTVINQPLDDDGEEDIREKSSFVLLVICTMVACPLAYIFILDSSSSSNLT